MPSTLTLAIPAYGRPGETAELLESILAAAALPDEVLLCEDLSPQREQIRAMVESFRTRFEQAGIALSYLENEQNLGFDRNLKNLVRLASSDWVVWMGNDDRLLSPGLAPLRAFVEAHPEVRFLSCAYEQFDGATGRPFHVQRYFPTDAIAKEDPSCVFKLSSFISGVSVHRAWALAHETDAFDGGLFYQVYLSACAFVEAGIGYVSSPIIGSRKGGTPLFGASATERKFHTPGRIAARGRANMYASVLEIAAHVDARHGSRIADGIRRELDSRQIFHVYEGFVGRPRGEILELFREMRGLGLGRSIVHKALFLTALCGSPIAPLLFHLARKARDAG
jgi:glycosyltransferase involved in cell wall biosynthesis